MIGLQQSLYPCLSGKFGCCTLLPSLLFFSDSSIQLQCLSKHSSRRHQPSAAIYTKHSHGIGFRYRSREALGFSLYGALVSYNEDYRYSRYLLECRVPKAHLETRHASFATALHTVVHLIDRSSQHWYGEDPRSREGSWDESSQQSI